MSNNQAPQNPTNPVAQIDLVALVGSLRAESVNRATFNAAQELLPAGVTLTEQSLRDVPLYDGDVEAVGDPAGVEALKASIAQADGVVIFTPEYNRSLPAITKNAIDWASRYPGEAALTDKPVAVVATTAGRHDAHGTRAATATALGGAGAAPFDESIGIGGAFGKIENSDLVDEEARASLAGYLARFSAHVDQARAGVLVDD